VRPWHRNEIARLVKTPKLHFMDSGLLSALRGHTSARLRQERQLFGPVLEGFVFTELRKACAWSEGAVSLHHFRDRDGHEVDFVLESAAGAVVGIEVKASATVTRGDFEGLRRLRDAAGAAFVTGIVLHDGEQTLAFGDRLYAAPLSAMWA
jgi:predicted AAA+ superfamily ATPase